MRERRARIPVVRKQGTLDFVSSPCVTLAPRLFCLNKNVRDIGKVKPTLSTTGRVGRPGGVAVVVTLKNATITGDHS